MAGREKEVRQVGGRNATPCKPACNGAKQTDNATAVEKWWGW